MGARLSSAVVGPAVRKLRLSRNLTLADLAERSGVPLSTLSKVELGQTSLTYEKLIRLCDALEIDLEKTMRLEADGAPAAAGRRSVIRAGQGDSAPFGPGLAHFPAAELLGKTMTPILLDLEPLDGGPPEPEHLPGEAYLMVLAGTVTFRCDLYADLHLDTEDSVYFDGRHGFRLWARGDKPARALLVAGGQIGS